MQAISSSPLGLIAGNGKFPLLVAQAARRQGRRIVAVAVREETCEDLAGEVDEIHWLSLGQLGRCIETFKQADVREAVMAGQVKHRQLFSGVVPDLKLMGVITRLTLKSTSSLLGGVAEVFEKEGIRLLSSVALLEDQLAQSRAMTRSRPSSVEMRDIRYGHQIARTLAGLDLGQSVAVKSQAVVALEAMEGTDEMILRAGRIAGPGATIVKVARPRQDMRFDVPVVGPGTLDAMAEAGARVLAVDADKTLLIEKEKLLTRADHLGVAVWGLTEEP